MVETRADTCRLATWNLNWPTPDSAKASRIGDILAGLEADVVVATETNVGLHLPETVGGYLVTGGEDWGYPPKPGRRKVAMWSRQAWRDVDAVGDAALPSGRFVAATTDTPMGPMRVVGVCIPWFAAHVSSGRRDASRWGEHLAYLEALAGVFAAQPQPCVIAGDFNQRIPRHRQPIRVADALTMALEGFEVLTVGEIDGRSMIDHVAFGAGLAGRVMTILPRDAQLGSLSDHWGVATELWTTGG